MIFDYIQKKGGHIYIATMMTEDLRTIQSTHPQQVCSQHTDKEHDAEDAVWREKTIRAQYCLPYYTCLWARDANLQRLIARHVSHIPIPSFLHRKDREGQTILSILHDLVVDRIELVKTARDTQTINVSICVATIADLSGETISLSLELPKELRPTFAKLVYGAIQTRFFSESPLRQAKQILETLMQDRLLSNARSAQGNSNPKQGCQQEIKDQDVRNSIMSYTKHAKLGLTEEIGKIITSRLTEAIYKSKIKAASRLCDQILDVEKARLNANKALDAISSNWTNMYTYDTAQLGQSPQQISDHVLEHLKTAHELKNLLIATKTMLRHELESMQKELREKGLCTPQELPDVATLTDEAVVEQLCLVLETLNKRHAREERMEEEQSANAEADGTTPGGELSQAFSVPNEETPTTYCSIL